MAIDYKKELENAARNMIFVHDPDLLIKMIVRMMVNKAKITHASFFLYNREKQGYMLMVSKGSLGKRIPLDLICIDKDDVLIHFFREHKSSFIFGREALLYSEAKSALENLKIKQETKQQLAQVLYQMELLETVVCIPSYFRGELLGILLLGKKENGRKFFDEELDFFVALNSNVAMAIRNAQLFKELEYQLDRKHQLFVRTTVALAAAIEAKDHYTHGHTTRVTNLSIEIAQRIAEKNKNEFDAKFLENLHIASLLHDIGKIGVPEHILNKRGGLTIGERNRIKEHPMIGVNILKPIKELEGSLLGVRYHHERFDGKGYPEGICGKQIPLVASIISVADSFDAMNTNRPYRSALDKHDAIHEIGSLSGKQFSPLVTDAFLELCKEGKF
ncbi:MAG: HD domain-containing protein [Candidatus Omnitrophica bacterium]|jgi:HD-GYP domain-containing protein (c-di-GMP phosphodiesterase class II)|nr:HD domain-containing protein [Candidatus Omnitrophota bacterium]MDD5660472.1 HD domain-containing protein [Candidatus Omnitrophota bacterium]